jgi:CubicO group peptidase (beta-lactamase class C family)
MKTQKRLVSLLLVLVLLLSVISLSSCQGGSGGTSYNKTIQLARDEIWKDINQGAASCGTVAILDNGEIVYSEVFGPADREKSVPTDSATIFNMGSVSKAFDATAVMLLVDDGKVKLDAPVTQYLPEFKMQDPRCKDITVRMLLNHTSGIPGTTYANNMGYGLNTTVYKETLKNLAGSQLKAAPGATAPYCNDGFTLAEMIVARVSGLDFADFCSKRIFGPLSLARTGVSVGQRNDKDYGVYYQAATGKKVPPETVSFLGAGGLSTTAKDLVIFADSFSTGGQKVLSKASIAEMTKAQPSEFSKTAQKTIGLNPEMSYGLGLDLTDIPSFKEQGIKVIGKGGDTDDYHSMMVSAPDKRLSVAVLEAGRGSSAANIAVELLKSALVEKGLLKDKKTSVVPPSPQPLPASYRGLAGRYMGDTSSYDLSFDFAANTVTLTIIKNGVVSRSIDMTYRDGKLHTANGTAFALISVDGKDCILSSVFGDSAYMSLGARLPAVGQPKALGIDINGMQWLWRNIKPFDGMTEAESQIITSVTSPDLPGYVDFTGIKRIGSPDFAGMAVSLIRDETELKLLSQNGQTWACVSEKIYSPIDTAAPLAVGDKSVTIGKEGYSEWFKAGENLVLNVQKPSRDRLIVFSSDGKPTYDSEIDTGEVFVPQGNMVEIAGNPGDAFKLTATSAAGK